ncbi:MAG: helix-turn-helix transcriptional regulator [Desulfobacula sp.]|nr:helix-turn-helix transcriptional regulator [Desulfobacula sp.]
MPEQNAYYEKIPWAEICRIIQETSDKSLYDLPEIAGVRKRTYQTWVNEGKKPSSIQPVKKLAKHLGLKIDHFQSLSSFVDNFSQQSIAGYSFTRAELYGIVDRDYAGKKGEKSTQTENKQTISSQEIFEVNHEMELKCTTLIGESQLYESLFKVLTDEDIDRLDATYFSSKIPEPENSYAQKYWDEIIKMSTKNQFRLRRIISLHQTDIHKKIWVLFRLIPDNFLYLNKKLFFSIFMTSHLNSELNELNKKIDLINFIMQYKSNKPGKGNLWIFGSHKEHDADEYVMLTLSNNFQYFLRLFNDTFYSAVALNKDILKIMIGQITNNKVPSIDEFIKNIEDDLYNLEFIGIKTDSEKDNIIKCYTKILE